ncbi:MAG: zf-HC2 domain-containing protein [Candidatus Omnitrophica bacterium]|nr:zf-HC2 domain-containing protein [Candidatus Omnitrophota bacterium]MCM8816137.1 zf-HC2 domain-containing protein [Candidatus Omnitrophota bacterium]
MRCEKYFQLISMYLDRELDQILLDDLQEHISLCENCMAFLKTMEKTIALSRAYYHKKCGRVPKSVSEHMFYHLRIIYKKRKI